MILEKICRLIELEVLAAPLHSYKESSYTGIV